MVYRALFLILLTQIASAIGTGTAAQTTPVRLTASEAARVADRERPDETTPVSVTKPFPFRPGEKLTYEVSFSKLIFSGSIGRLDFSVSEPDKSNPGLIELNAEAVSKGFFTWLFGIKVKDRFKAVVNEEDFGLHSSVKMLEEGKVRREHQALIDRENGRVVYTERNLDDKSGALKKKEEPSPRWVQDILSAIYLVRTQPLKEGTKLTLPISDAGKLYKIEIIASKREEVKVAAGKFQALQVEARVFDGKFINRSGQMVVWVSNDSSRVPVKARIKTGGATVTISLARIH